MNRSYNDYIETLNKSKENKLSARLKTQTNQ